LGFLPLSQYFFGSERGYAIAQAHCLADQLGHEFVSVEARHQQHPIHPIEHVSQELVCQLVADFDAPLARLFHSSQVFVWDHYPCELVVAELSMSEALERHDLDDGRDLGMRYAREEAVELLQVVERLRDREVSASLDLLVVPVKLEFEVLGHWIDSARHQEVR